MFLRKTKLSDNKKIKRLCANKSARFSHMWQYVDQQTKTTLERIGLKNKQSNRLIVACEWRIIRAHNIRQQIHVTIVFIAVEATTFISTDCSPEHPNRHLNESSQEFFNVCTMGCCETRLPMTDMIRIVASTGWTFIIFVLHLRFCK